MSTDTRIEPFLRAFTRFEQALNGGAAGAPHARRREALARAEAAGLPTQKHEEWRYTSLAPVLEHTFEPGATAARPVVTAADVASFLPAGMRGALCVFVNGRYDASLSTAPEGVEVTDLRALPDAAANTMQEAGDGVFADLNAAFLLDGALLRIPRGLRVADPLSVLFLTAGGVQTHPRLRIEAGEGSEAVIVQVHAGLDDGASLTNVVTEIVAGPSASITNVRIQREGAGTVHIATTLARLERDARVHDHFSALGGRLTRNTVRAVLDGEGAHCTLDGLFAPSGTQHMDSHTFVDHARPFCSTEELYKGVIAGAGRGVFTGRILVRPGAQKTDARQSNRNLLLSANARMDTRPQLEIFADDVRCTHGATIGRLDEDALYYLRSRGIGTDEARMMLTAAFAGEVVERVPVEAVRAWLRTLLEERLAAAGKEERR